jgi:hypothetical protein
VDLLHSLWWILGGGGLVVVIAVVAIVLVGGWTLLLDRRVLSVIALAIAALAAVAWWEHTKAAWIAQGRAEGEAEREQMRVQRRSDIADYVVAGAQRAAVADAELRRLRGALELAQSNRPQEVGSYVTSKANAGCSITDGFVRYHDAAVPRAAGRPAFPATAIGDVDRPSGVPLARVESVVAGNYDACQELVGRIPTLRAWCARECAAWDAKWGTKSDCARRCAPEAPRNSETKGR